MRRLLRTVAFRGTAGIAAAARHAAPPARHVPAAGLGAPPDDAPIPARCGGFVRSHEVRLSLCCTGGTPRIPDAERRLRYVDLRIGPDRRTNGSSRGVAGALPSSSGPGARAGSSCRSGMEGRPAPWGSRRGLRNVAVPRSDPDRRHRHGRRRFDLHCGEVRRLVQQGRQAAGVSGHRQPERAVDGIAGVSFFRRARIFLVPIALSHAMAWLSLAATADRVDLAAGPWVWSGAARGVLEVVSG